MAVTFITPPGLVKPRGYNHGAIGTGRMLFVAGQVGTDKDGKLVSDDLAEQFDRALGCVVSVVKEAGGNPEDIAKINILVLDAKAYSGANIGQAYKKHLGRHFPAMTLAEVKGLYDEGLKVEIEAVAILP